MYNGSNLLVFNELSIDLQAKTVSIHKRQPLKFTRKEFALLIYFIANKGKVVSKNAIAEHLMGRWHRSGR
jgi:DNA-binding response OmpR family regulator